MTPPQPISPTPATPATPATPVTPSPHLESADFVAHLAAAQRELGAFIYALVPHWQDAEEILQETSARLWEQRADYDPTRPFLPWARAVAHYQVLAHRTRQRRARIQFSQPVIDRLADEASAMEPQQDRRAEFLRKCLERMNPAVRQLLTHSYFGGKTIGEVAGLLRKTEAATYKALARARWSLHECIHQKMQEVERL